MPTVREIARDDLEQKIRFEQKLAAELVKIDNEMTRDFIRRLDQGEVLQAAEYQDQFRGMLLDHYNDVGEVFSKRIRKDLPSEVAITEQEEVLIASALAAYFLTRSEKQAAIITGTNQKNIISAIDAGIAEAQRQIDEGTTPSQRERAVISGQSLNRKLKGRISAISNVETQTPAETSKQTEAEVLSGHRPSIAGGFARTPKITKEWVTAGDEKVRTEPFNHLAADQQEVELSAPYVVSGQHLRWPGDTDLGASIGNVGNCRCGSVENRDQILSARVDTRQDILDQATGIFGVDDALSAI